MVNPLILTAVAFVVSTGVVLLVALFLAHRRPRLQARLSELTEEGNAANRQTTRGRASLARAALPRMGAAMMPTNEEKQTALKKRLARSGFYGRQAIAIYMGAKVVLLVAPCVLGVLVSIVFRFPLMYGIAGGVVIGSYASIMAPGFWLDMRKRSRQSDLRRSFPDALDLLVICLEGGLSFNAALRHIAVELRTVYPLLAGELSIVQREVQLGKSVGKALQEFGQRSDMEEVQTLATAVAQAEQFGSSMAKTMRVQSETQRLRRIQRAEAKAGKAAVMILFPTLFLIFPSIFVVILGPAAVQIWDLLKQMS